MSLGQTLRRQTLRGLKASPAAKKICLLNMNLETLFSRPKGSFGNRGGGQSVWLDEAGDLYFAEFWPREGERNGLAKLSKASFLARIP
jgi:hypothetical protein